MIDKVSEFYNKVRLLNLPWVVDPKTKEPSVSLTLMIVSFVLALAAWALILAKKIEAPSIIMELFYSTACLYFGRKISPRKDINSK